MLVLKTIRPSGGPEPIRFVAPVFVSCCVLLTFLGNNPYEKVKCNVLGR